jgi:hypothetical protein
MRKIFALLLLTGIFYLSSCGNGGNDKLPVPVAADSTSNGDSVQLAYTNDNFVAENFLIVDYTLHNVPVYQIFGSNIYSYSDSMWHLKLQLIDQKLQQMALYITLTGTAQTGDFYVTDNSGSLVNYVHGDNATYMVSPGSVANVSSGAYPLRGTLNLTLYRNHKMYPAVGTFKVFK